MPDILRGMTQSSLARGLLEEIEAFLKSSGMSATYFGKCVRNSNVVATLRDGGDVTTKTVERVRAFIRLRSENHNQISGETPSGAA